MTTSPTPGGGETVDPADESGSGVAAAEAARRARSAADRVGAGAGATAEGDAASATEGKVSAPDVAALLARVEEHKSTVNPMWFGAGTYTDLVVDLATALRAALGMEATP